MVWWRKSKITEDDIEKGAAESLLKETESAVDRAYEAAREARSLIKRLRDTHAAETFTESLLTELSRPRDHPHTHPRTNPGG